MATIAMTGSAGGMGAATRKRLEGDGNRFIGVDVHDAEVVADLSTPAGRADMVAGVTAASDGVLDGLIAGAGVMGPDGPTVASVNYFGAIATLVELQPLLARGTSSSAVAISSNSTTTFPGIRADIVEACLGGDEDATRELADGVDPVAVYPASKLALARWVRRNAPTDAWIGAGIRLNAVAPGLISTPMTHGIEETVLGLGDVFPIPQRRAGQPDEIAALLAFMLSAENSFMCGTVVFVDGGTDATLRGDAWPAGL